MMDKAEWEDKLPRDKARYFNRKRMSLEFFAQKMRLSKTTILKDFDKNGFSYDEEERLFIKNED